MDGNKVLEVIGVYKDCFEALGVPKIHFPQNKIVNSPEIVLAHCHGMMDEMEKFIAEGRMDKVFGWLGFIQGCLWSIGCYDLESLKNHNRPDPAD